jgi:hypothetical protein
VRLSFELCFSRRLRRWRSLWFKDFGRITENKCLEMQLCRDATIASICIDTDFAGQCHAGPSLELGLLGYSFRIAVYDHRHWDYDRDVWEEHSGTVEAS